MASPVLAFMAGLGSGYLRTKDKAAEDERRAKLDKIVTDRAEREAKDYARMQAEREERAAAVQPVEPVSGEVFMPRVDDEGNPMPANPTAGTFTVGDRRFATMEEARKAAEAMNTPEARNDRLLAVMQRQDPVRAQQFQTTLMQGKAAGLQLEQAQLDLANRKFDAAIAGLDSHEAIAQAADQMGAKLEARPGANGKVEYWRVGADGKATRTPYSFDNTPEGVAQAKLALSKATPLSTKIQFAFQRDQARRADERDQRDFGLRERAQDDLGAFRRASLELDRRRLGIQEAAAREASRLPPAVKAQYDTFGKQLATVDSALAKAQAEGMFDPASPGAQGLLAQRAVLVGRMNRLLAPYLGQSQGDDPLGLFTQDRAAPSAGTAGGSAAATPAQSAAPPPEPNALQKAIATMTGRRPLFDQQEAAPSEAGRLDQARAATRQARSALQRYGLRQRQADPEGFQRAKAALEAAQAAEKEALTAWQRTVKTRDMAVMQ